MANATLSVRIDAVISPIKKALKNISKELKKTFSPKETTDALNKSFKQLDGALAGLNAGMVTWSKGIKEVNKSTANLFKQYRKIQTATGRPWSKELGVKYAPIKKQLKDLYTLRKKYNKEGAKLSYSRANRQIQELKKYKRSGLKFTPEGVATYYKYEKYGKDFVEREKQYRKDLWQLSNAQHDYDTKWGGKSKTKLEAEMNAYKSKMEAERQRVNLATMAGNNPDMAKLDEYSDKYMKLKTELEGWTADEKALAEAKKKVEGYSDSEVQKFEEMNKEFKETKKTLEEGSNKKGNKGFLGEIWQKITALPRLLGRIFTRYLGYQLIKGIFGNLEEGMQNLYAWSRYYSKQWSDILDKQKSMQVALGNAFATVKAVFLEAIGPMFNDIMKQLVAIINRVTRLLAELFNLPTYLQARDDILIRWSENIKNTRQLIQGFDNLNIWKGSDNTLPKDMFYEVKNNNNGVSVIQALADFWKDTLKPGLLIIWDAFKILWETTIEPLLRGLWTSIKEIFGNLFPKLKTWWNGITDEDYDENGNIIVRQVEPGFKHALIDWWNGVWAKVKEWFIGDETRGTTGVWQNNIKPFLENVWAVVRQFLIGDFVGAIKEALRALFPNYTEWYEGDTPLATYVRTNTEAGTKMPIAGAGTAGAGYPDAGSGSFSNFIVELWQMIFKKGKYATNANGGVYTTPHLGLVGEASTRANPELITPQALLDDRLQANNRELLGAMNGMMNNLIGAVNGINMEVKIGDDVIARSASRGNNAYYKMTGRPLIR